MLLISGTRENRAPIYGDCRLEMVLFIRESIMQVTLGVVSFIDDDDDDDGETARDFILTQALNVYGTVCLITPWSKFEYLASRINPFAFISARVN